VRVRLNLGLAYVPRDRGSGAGRSPMRLAQIARNDCAPPGEWWQRLVHLGAALTCGAMHQRIPWDMFGRRRPREPLGRNLQKFLLGEIEQNPRCGACAAAWGVAGGFRGIAGSVIDLAAKAVAILGGVEELSEIIEICDRVRSWPAADFARARGVPPPMRRMRAKWIAGMFHEAACTPQGDFAALFPDPRHCAHSRPARCALRRPLLAKRLTPRCRGRALSGFAANPMRRFRPFSSTGFRTVNEFLGMAVEASPLASWGCGSPSGTAAPCGISRGEGQQKGRILRATGVADHIVLREKC